MDVVGVEIYIPNIKVLLPMQVALFPESDDTLYSPA